MPSMNISSVTHSTSPCSPPSLSDCVVYFQVMCAGVCYRSKRSMSVNSAASLASISSDHSSCSNKGVRDTSLFPGGCRQEGWSPRPGPSSPNGVMCWDLSCLHSAARKSNDQRNLAATLACGLSSASSAHRWRMFIQPELGLAIPLTTANNCNYVAFWHSVAFPGAAGHWGRGNLLSGPAYRTNKHKE